MAKKKGSLTLSINAIVVLIMAITILGLGLGFIKKQFSSAQSQFDITNQKLKGDMIKEIEASGDKLTFKQARFEVKSGEKYEFYIAIRNTGPYTQRFWLHWVCENRLDASSGFSCESTDMRDASGQWKWFTSYKYIELEPGASEAFIATVQPTGTSNTYMGKLKVYFTDDQKDQDPASWENPGSEFKDYDEKDFYLNVI